MEKLQRIWNRLFGEKCRRCGHPSHCNEECTVCLQWNACLDCECSKCGISDETLILKSYEEALK